MNVDSIVFKTYPRVICESNTDNSFCCCNSVTKAHTKHLQKHLQNTLHRNSPEVEIVATRPTPTATCFSNSETSVLVSTPVSLKLGIAQPNCKSKLRKVKISINLYDTTLHGTITYPLKIDPWKRRFLLETISFRGHVSCREGNFETIRVYRSKLLATIHILAREFHILSSSSCQHGKLLGK